MRLSHFVINISQDRPFWSAGQKIKGNVYFEVAKTKMVYSVTITLSGKAAVKWPKQRQFLTSQEYFTGSNVIFSDMTYYLYGESNLVREMQAGQHQYPFSIQLPTTIASSFEGNCGNIRYVLTARISRPNKVDRLCAKNVPVRELVDLDTPQLTRPMSVSKEKILCSFCCTSQPVKVSASIERHGHSVGNIISISVDCTHKKITYLNAYLRQKVEYHAGIQTKCTYKVISRTTIDDWTVGNIRIPPTTAPTIRNCRVIRVSYEVVTILNFRIPGFKSLCLPPIPVTIGNVSSGEDQPSYSAAPTNTNARNSVVAQTSAPFASFSVQPSAPPASFSIPGYTGILQPLAAVQQTSSSIVQQPVNAINSVDIPNTPPPSYTESITLQDPYPTQTTFYLPPEQCSQQAINSWIPPAENTEFTD
ncbi:arrestin domain-containing protein 3-like [Dysidea avara]|uniref:arrestin domain-containing protein 3-like n=1 Tax=Dysidea avara TaxID=196820 RepID=UPI00332152BB